MQRILKGAGRAKRLKAMEQKEVDWKKSRAKMAEIRQSQIMIKGIEDRYLREERQHRREDWMLGPLAPNRDSGVSRNVVGTIDPQLRQIPEVLEPVANVLKAQKHKFTGTSMAGNVVVHDRVVVVAGPERLRGLIGEVIDIDNEKHTLRLKNINLVDTEVPLSSYLTTKGADLSTDTGFFQTSEEAIPIENTRLVVDMPLFDPETGEPEPTTPMIVRHVHAARPYIKRSPGSNAPKHTRYITGSETFSYDGRKIKIPWPEKEEKSEPEVSTSNDTTEEHIRASTWRPEMLFGPLGYRPTELLPIEDAASAYTTGLEHKDEVGEDANYERAGVHGFMNETKLVARNKRIANGIMNELSGGKPSKRRNLKVDQNELNATKMLEDARAIWWQERAKELGTKPVIAAVRKERSKMRREVSQEAYAEEQGIKKEIKPGKQGRTLATMNGSLDSMIQSVNARAKLLSKYDTPEVLKGLAQDRPFTKLDRKFQRKLARL